MARYTGPSWKLSRRLGFSILENGKELQKRPYAPGQHGKGRRTKLSEYGLQLHEKQKVRFMYGVNEKQFHTTFKKAKKKRLDPILGSGFLFLLECRLDNLVYRMGLSNTRRGARQLVNHNHILVDGKKVNIPSYSVKPGQTISIREKSKNLATIKEAMEARVHIPEFVEFDANKMEGKFVRLPQRNELNQEINESLIVEYYNKLG
ncbi:30S ribosomal protein S4 [Mycoplasma sp. P36-A1]|uniref:30S ribosomal protein S4 n=1 Tax=Mycoplasma sp. P36-A1 TaxID=3252900 RepID=UPI003C2F6A84